MFYRVWDNFKNEWINDDVYLSSDGVIYVAKKGWFGKTKLIEEENDRYVVHKSIMLNDKNSTEICEGDYIKAQIDEGKSVTGVVVYAQELAAYIILCFEKDEYYTLSSEVCEYIEIIGNVFDGFKEGFRDGKQALRESEE